MRPWFSAGSLFLSKTNSLLGNLVQDVPYSFSQEREAEDESQIAFTGTGSSLSTFQLFLEMKRCRNSKLVLENLSSFRNAPRIQAAARLGV